MNKKTNETTDHTYIPMTSITSRTGVEVLKDLYYYTDQIVNICFIGYPDKGEWVLIDTGLPYSTSEILKVVTDRFGQGSKPSAIILTHGHFDHVGGLKELVDEWKIPVYAHELELPYLRGEKSYPEPDDTVEGGLLAKIASIYPNEPIYIEGDVKPLPADHSIPGLQEWVWIHTPGHSPGHVSFFRKTDSVLLSGDAFITVRQDSFYRVLMQSPEINGPPRYFTTDWQAAWDSVKKLAELQPKVVISGHGVMMGGKQLNIQLDKLVQEFDRIAIPKYGKYVNKNGRLH